MEEFLKKIKDNFEIGEPIFTNEILALFDLSKQRTMELLKKSIDNGDIKKIERGVYYVPYKKTLSYNGVVFEGLETDNEPTTEEIIIKKYKYNNKGEVYGIDDGMVLENDLHLTTQVPQVYNIITNNESRNMRVVKIGNEEVRLKKPYVKITKDNYKEYEVLQAINVLSNMNHRTAQQIKDDIKRYGKNKERMIKMLPYFPEKVKHRVEKFEVLK